MFAMQVHGGEAVTEPTPPPIPHARVERAKVSAAKRLRLALIPGDRDVDARLRSHALKATKAVTALGILALAMRAAFGMLGKYVDASVTAQGEMLKMQGAMNEGVLERMADIASASSRQADSTATVARHVGVLLDRAKVDVRPAKPGHTTIYVEPAPVIIQQVPVTPAPPRVEPPPKQPPPRNPGARER
jgi:hypothetical protein